MYIGLNTLSGHTAENKRVSKVLIFWDREKLCEDDMQSLQVPAIASLLPMLPAMLRFVIALKKIFVYKWHNGNLLQSK